MKSDEALTLLSLPKIKTKKEKSEQITNFQETSG
jgi:hypothetical protein